MNEWPSNGFSFTNTFFILFSQIAIYVAFKRADWRRVLLFFGEHLQQQTAENSELFNITSASVGNMSNNTEKTLEHWFYLFDSATFFIRLNIQIIIASQKRYLNALYNFGSMKNRKQSTIIIWMSRCFGHHPSSRFHVMQFERDCIFCLNSHADSHENLQLVFLFSIKDSSTPKSIHMNSVSWRNNVIVILLVRLPPK